MFQCILVPLDGTPDAESAIPVAAHLARAGRGRLVLAHVQTPPVPISEVQGLMFADARLAAELEATARRYLDDVTGRVSPRAGVPVEAALLHGAVADRLHDLAVERGADLIVIASHDRGMLAHLLSGSVAERLAREGGVPVLVVRRSADAGGRVGAEEEDVAAAGRTASSGSVGRGAFRRILVPLDGTGASEAVLGPAVRLARASEAAITLMTAQNPTAPTDAGARAGAFAGDYLADVARRLRADGLEADRCVVEERHPAEAITSCAASVGADVIAMATSHGGGVLTHLLGGSVADRVLHSAVVPILLVHTKGGGHGDRGAGDDPKGDRPDARAERGAEPPAA